MSVIGRLLQPLRCLAIRANVQESIRSVSVLSWALNREQVWQTRSFATSNQGVTKLKMHSRTPYIIFASEKMADLRSANPGIRVPDLGRKLGQMWRMLSEEEKELYRAKYVKEKIAFDEKKKASIAKLSEEEMEKIKFEAQERRKRLSIRRRKKLLKLLEKPKPGDVNPYILYVKAQALERGDAPFQQYMKGLSEYWKKMPEEDKQPFVEQARANSVKYRLRLAEWEQRMIKEGRENLVRRSALRRPKNPRKAKHTRKAPQKSATQKKGIKTRSAKTRTVGTQTGAKKREE